MKKILKVYPSGYMSLNLYDDNGSFVCLLKQSRENLTDAEVQCVDKEYPMYKDRSKNLRKIGFDTYDDYLQSPEWKEFRDKLIKEGCICCGAPAYTVHHMNYQKKVLRLDKKNIHNDLIPVCRSCHHKIEFDDNGVKRMDTHELREAVIQLCITNNHFPKDRCFRCFRKRRRYFKISKGYQICPICRGEQRRLKRAKHASQSKYS